MSSYARNKGHKYETQVVNELIEIYQSPFHTTRYMSKGMDDGKIDIYDDCGVCPCYFQLKKTKNIPSVKNINRDVLLKDKPLCILWNVQEKKDGNKNCTSAGEYAIIPKDFLYELLKAKNEIQNSKKDIL